MTTLPRPAGPALVLRDCRIVDGLGGPAVEDELWIAGGRIVKPGSAPVELLESLAGRVVAPGLVDAHVHLCLDAGPDPLASFRDASPDDLMMRMRRHAEQTLLAGVTTVRDLGAPAGLILALREEIRSGRASGPRILASGTPLTIPDGHLYEMGGAVRGRGAIHSLVRSLRRQGVDLIKVMATGGGSSPQTDPRACQFTDREMRALVDEAGIAGLPVACHAHADAGVRQAADAGVATIEHGSYASRSTLETMAAGGIALVPTLAPALCALPHDLPAARRAAILGRLSARQEVVRAAARVGVRVLAGTDAGVAFTPHGNVVSEILALMQCGLAPRQAMAAAGRTAGRALGRPDVGVLILGAVADLIVLARDPFEDPQVLARPLAVMQAGQWIRPPAG